MHHFTSPFPSFTRRQRQTSETSTSPPSSRTTSPPASPTSTFRPFSQAIPLPNNLFNLSFHPNSNPKSETGDSVESTDDHEHHNQQHGSSSHPHCGVSILPCAVLRGRSSMMVLRRRPSKTDLALSEERSRCDCDAIERQGLDLMEPRPVDMDLHAQRRSVQCRQTPMSRVSVGPERNSLQQQQQQQQQPRFVMGGIFEVMEGRA